MEALAEVAGGDELAVLAGQRPVVDGKLHLDGRRIEFRERDRLAVLAVAKRLANGEFLEPGDADDIAGLAGDRFRRISSR